MLQWSQYLSKIGLATALVAFTTEDYYEFELWGDGMRLLEGQDLFNEVDSYFELVFVLQPNYIKHCQTTVQIMQLKVLEYEDIELGGLTSMKKDQALMKFRKFENSLNKINV